MFDKELIKSIFSNSLVVCDRNHDTAVLSHKQCKKVDILLNFDTHSDLTVNSKIEFHTIANWVGNFIQSCEVDEIIYVLPEYLINNSDYDKVFDGYTYPRFKHNFISFDNLTSLSNLPIQENIYYFPKTEEIISEKNFESLKKSFEKANIEFPYKEKIDYRIIKLTMTTLDKLGDFQNKCVFLSIDADYLSNTGYDTYKGINNKNDKTDTEKFIRELKKHNIIPSYTSLCYSPMYSQTEHREEIEKLFTEIQNYGKN